MALVDWKSKNVVYRCSDFMTALERHYVSVIDPSLAPTPEILVKDPAMEMALRIFRHAVSTYGLPPDHKALSRDENARKIYGFWNQQHFETFVNGVFRAGVVQTPFERRGERGALRNIYTLTPLAAEALFALGFMMLEEAKETKGRSSPKKKGWRHFVQKTKERLGENHPVSAILHEPSRPLKPSKKDMIEEQQEQEQGDEEEKRKPILIKFLLFVPRALDLCLLVLQRTILLSLQGIICRLWKDQRRGQEKIHFQMIRLKSWG